MYTDHLGNVRHVSRSTPSGTATIAQANNYYPFGGLLKEGEHHWDIQNRFYNGKEYDRMQGLNLYDYSARQYDPAVCQFTSIDPLCEKYYHISPYIYCGGNPVKYVDPDGRDYYIHFKGDEVFIEADYYVSSSMSDFYKQEIQNSIKELNKYSEKNWTYKDDNGNKYKIRVDLRMVELSPEEFAEKEQRFIDKKELSSEYEGNTISFGEVEQYGKNNEVVTGVTNSGRAIIIDRELKGFMTMQHEIGHSLSLGHDYSGLMTAKSNDPNRADGFLTKSDFVKIINNVYNIKPVNAKGYIVK